MPHFLDKQRIYFTRAIHKYIPKSNRTKMLSEKNLAVTLDFYTGMGCVSTVSACHF